MSENKEDSNFTLPSSQSDRKKIRSLLQEIAGQYQMIDDRKSAVKDIVDAIHDEYKIPKKIISGLAKTVYKHNYGDVAHDNTIFELCYEGIVETVATTQETEETP